MTDDTILWRCHVNAFKYTKADAAALTAAVRSVYPGAPEVLPEHTTKLISGKRVAVLEAEDGSRLTLTRGGSTNEGGFHHEIHVVYEPGDYGLAEFDRIMVSLAHSAPVAAAIEAIQLDEIGLPPLARPSVPEAAAQREQKTPSPVRTAQPAKPKGFGAAFMEGYRGTQT